jgi:N-acyl-D-aspartate/D-glutamate deacylase
MLRTLEYVEGMDLHTLEEGVTWGWETYPQYLDAISSRGTGINFGGYVGHTAVRLAVMGAEAYERPASIAEIEAMKQVVREAILGGAVGFSTDRSPYHRAYEAKRVPSAVGSREEVVSLMASVGDVARGVCMAIVDPNDFEWVFEIQAAIGRPMNWCQLMTWPAKSPWLGSTQLQMDRLRIAREAGASVYAQATCKPVTQQFTFSNPITFFPAPAFAETASLSPEEKLARYRDVVWRGRAHADLAGYTDPNWTKWVVTETKTQQSLVGKTISELAEATGKTPLDAALDISMEDDLQTRFTVTSANDDVEALKAILRAPGSVLGLSDAGAHCDQMCDANMLTDFLAYWVRDRELMPLEEGVRKVSGEPAAVLELRDRGTIELGMAADVAVWDLDNLDPGPLRGVSDFPGSRSRLSADSPRGFRHVLVNGVPIRRDTVSLARSLDNLPGRIVRS